MKIVHIITGLNDGGAESVLYRLCISDKENEHVVISFLDDGKYGSLLKNSGISVYCLNMSHGPLGLFKLHKLYLLILRLRPDVAQTWMYHADLLGGLVARLAGVSNVIWTLRNSTLAFGKTKFSTIIVRRLNALASHFIPKCIVSCSYKGVDVHRAIGFSAKKMKVIGNGYDLKIYLPNHRAASRLRAELNIPPDVFLIGMVARFDSQKDHANLLRALSLLKFSGKTMHCLMAGEKVVSDNLLLKEMINKYDIVDVVHFLGPFNNVPALMSALDLNILSSAYGEAFPNVVAEAMACGTPSVVTDVGDASLIVADTGWVVQPQDPAALANAINLAFEEWSNKTLWRSRELLSRRRIENNYNLEIMLGAYRIVWRSES